MYDIVENEASSLPHFFHLIWFSETETEKETEKETV